MTGRDIDCSLYAHGKIVTDATFWKDEALEGSERRYRFSRESLRKFQDADCAISLSSRYPSDEPVGPRVEARARLLLHQPLCFHNDLFGYGNDCESGERNQLSRPPARNPPSP